MVDITEMKILGKKWWILWPKFECWERSGVSESELRCEKRKCVYTHSSKELWQANKLTMRIEERRSQDMNKKGAISKYSNGDNAIKDTNRRRRRKKRTRKWTPTPFNIIIIINLEISSQIRIWMNFQVHVRNRRNGCSCVNHLIHCTVMYSSSTLSLAVFSLSNIVSVLLCSDSWWFDLLAVKYY